MASPQEVFQEFFGFCQKVLAGEDKKFLELIETRYNKCDEAFRNSAFMTTLLKETKRKMGSEKSRLFVHLKDLLTTFKDRRKRKGSTDYSGKKDNGREDAGKNVKICSIVVEKLQQMVPHEYKSEVETVVNSRLDEKGSKYKCIMKDADFQSTKIIIVATESQLKNLLHEFKCPSQSKEIVGKSNCSYKPFCPTHFCHSSDLAIYLPSTSSQDSVENNDDEDASASCTDEYDSMGADQKRISSKSVQLKVFSGSDSVILPTFCKKDNEEYVHEAESNVKIENLINDENIVSEAGISDENFESEASVEPEISECENDFSNPSRDFIGNALYSKRTGSSRSVSIEEINGADSFIFSYNSETTDHCIDHSDHKYHYKYGHSTRLKYTEISSNKGFNSKVKLLEKHFIPLDIELDTALNCDTLKDKLSASSFSGTENGGVNSHKDRDIHGQSSKKSSNQRDKTKTVNPADDSSGLEASVNINSVYPLSPIILVKPPQSNFNVNAEQETEDARYVISSSDEEIDVNESKGTVKGLPSKECCIHPNHNSSSGTSDTTCSSTPAANNIQIKACDAASIISNRQPQTVTTTTESIQTGSAAITVALNDTHPEIVTAPSTTVTTVSEDCHAQMENATSTSATSNALTEIVVSTSAAGIIQTESVFASSTIASYIETGTVATTTASGNIQARTVAAMTTAGNIHTKTVASNCVTDSVQMATAASTMTTGNLHPVITASTTADGIAQTRTVASTTAAGDIQTGSVASITAAGDISSRTVASTTAIGNIQTETIANTTANGNIQTETVASTTASGNIQIETVTSTTVAGNIQKETVVSLTEVKEVGKDFNVELFELKKGTEAKLSGEKSDLKIKDVMDKDTLEDCLILEQSNTGYGPNESSTEYGKRHWHGSLCENRSDNSVNITPTDKASPVKGKVKKVPFVTLSKIDDPGSASKTTFMEMLSLHSQPATAKDSKMSRTDIPLKMNTNISDSKSSHSPQPSTSREVTFPSEEELSENEFECSSTMDKRMSSDDQPEDRHVKRLEGLLKKLHDEIVKCQNRDLSLEDMEAEDSDYIYEDKLEKKFVACWSKLCELKKQTTSTGRPTQKAINYSGTRYEEINKQLERFLRKRKVFPDFHDVLKVVKSTNKKYELSIHPRKLHDLAREAFEDIGRMLQRRRQEDLAISIRSRHINHQMHGPDPALSDPILRKKLEANQKVARSNLENVIEKYSQMQHTMGDEEGSCSAEEEEVDDSEDDIFNGGMSNDKGKMSAEERDKFYKRRRIESDGEEETRADSLDDDDCELISCFNGKDEIPSPEGQDLSEGENDIPSIEVDIASDEDVDIFESGLNKERGGSQEDLRNKDVEVIDSDCDASDIEDNAYQRPDNQDSLNDKGREISDREVKEKNGSQSESRAQPSAMSDTLPIIKIEDIISISKTAFLNEKKTSKGDDKDNRTNEADENSDDSDIMIIDDHDDKKKAFTPAGPVGEILPQTTYKTGAKMRKEPCDTTSVKSKQSFSSSDKFTSDKSNPQASCASPVDDILSKVSRKFDEKIKKLVKSRQEKHSVKSDSHSPPSNGIKMQSWSEIKDKNQPTSICRGESAKKADELPKPSVITDGDDIEVTEIDFSKKGHFSSDSSSYCSILNVKTDVNNLAWEDSGAICGKTCESDVQNKTCIKKSSSLEPLPERKTDSEIITIQSSSVLEEGADKKTTGSAVSESQSVQDKDKEEEKIDVITSGSSVQKRDDDVVELIDMVILEESTSEKDVKEKTTGSAVSESRSDQDKGKETETLPQIHIDMSHNGDSEQNISIENVACGKNESCSLADKTDCSPSDSGIICIPSDMNNLPDPKHVETETAKTTTVVAVENGNSVEKDDASQKIISTYPLSGRVAVDNEESCSSDENKSKNRGGGDLNERCVENGNETVDHEADDGRRGQGEGCVPNGKVASAPKVKKISEEAEGRLASGGSEMESEREVEGNGSQLKNKENSVTGKEQPQASMFDEENSNQEEDILESVTKLCEAILNTDDDDKQLKAKENRDNNDESIVLEGDSVEADSMTTKKASENRDSNNESVVVLVGDSVDADSTTTKKAGSEHLSNPTEKKNGHDEVLVSASEDEESEMGEKRKVKATELVNGNESTMLSNEESMDGKASVNSPSDSDKSANSTSINIRDLCGHETAKTKTMDKIKVEAREKVSNLLHEACLMVKGHKNTNIMTSEKASDQNAERKRKSHLAKNNAEDDDDDDDDLEITAVEYIPESKKQKKGPGKTYPRILGSARSVRTDVNRSAVSCKMRAPTPDLNFTSAKPKSLMPTSNNAVNWNLIRASIAPIVKDKQHFYPDVSKTATAHHKQRPFVNHSVTGQSSGISSRSHKTPVILPKSIKSLSPRVPFPSSHHHHNHHSNIVSSSSYNSQHVTIPINSCKRPLVKSSSSLPYPTSAPIAHNKFPSPSINKRRVDDLVMVVDDFNDKETGKTSSQPRVKLIQRNSTETSSSRERCPKRKAGAISSQQQASVKKAKSLSGISIVLSDSD